MGSEASPDRRSDAWRPTTAERNAWRPTDRRTRRLAAPDRRTRRLSGLRTAERDASAAHRPQNAIAPQTAERDASAADPRMATDRRTGRLGGLRTAERDEEAVQDQLPHHREPLPCAAPRHPRPAGPRARRGSGATVRSPSQAPTSPASTVSACRARRIPRCWRSTIVSGSLRPRLAVALLAHVDAGRQPGPQQRRVGRGRDEVGAARPVGHLAPQRLLDLERPLLEAQHRLTVHPTEVQPAEPDGLDVLALEPRQPRVVPPRRSPAARARPRP